MNIKAILLSTLLLLLTPFAFAGSGHDHGHGHSHEPVTQQQAEIKAAGIVNNLVNNGVINQSWTNTQASKSEKKEFGGNLEWVVSFKNDSVDDPQKRSLYIFLSLTGNYIAANYTGK